MIVALTGAGISRPSGIPTFEEQPGLQAALTRDYFDTRPEDFYEQYWQMVALMESVKPNPAHLALAKSKIPIITQNIDCLHQRAGSGELAQIHGYYDEFICERCQSIHNLPDGLKPIPYRCPQCESVLKPKVVLYGEQLLEWELAISWAQAADTLIVVGTSLTVYPAAYIPQIVKAQGGEVIIVNEAADTRLPALLAQRLG